MKKRPSLALLISLTAINLTACWFSDKFIWVLAAVGMALFLSLEKNTLVCLTALFLYFGFSWYFYAYYQEMNAVSSDAAETTYQAVILDVQYSESRLSLTLKRDDHARVMLYVYDLEKTFYPGEQIMFSSQFETASGNRNPGGYNEERTLLSQGIRLKASLDNADQIEKIGQIDSFLFRLRRYRLDLDAKNREIMGEEAAELVSALSLGVGAGSKLKDIFRNAGLSHLLALSGLHVSIVGVLIAAVFSKIRPVFLGTFLTILSIVLFIFLSSLSASILRAAMMFSFGLICVACRRSYDSLTSLSLAGLAVLAIRPSLLLSTGFILSFLAVFSIALFYRPTVYRLENLGFTGWIVEGLALTVSASLLTVFVCLLSYHEWNPVSLLSNLVLVPIASVLVSLSFLQTLLSAFIPSAAWILAGFMRKLIGVFLGAVSFFSEYQTVLLLPSLGWTVFLMVIALLAFSVYGYFQRVSIFKVSLLSVLLFSAVLWIPRPLELIFLDVGQGDAALLKMPNGKAILIDGGGYTSSLENASTKTISEKTLIPALKAEGIATLEAVFISHEHEDHMQGIEEVLQVYPCENIYVSSAFSDTDFENRLNASFTRLQTGDSFRLSGAAFQVLSPDLSETFSEDEENEASLVFLLRYQNLSVLFTGDIGQTTEEKIIESIPEKQENEFRVLKVAHHGSAYSSSEIFLEICQADTALIGVGQYNLYGHPASQTLTRLEEMVGSVYRTDECGAVRIRQGFFVQSVSCYLHKTHDSRSG